jgi:hypothetical protein
MQSFNIVKVSTMKHLDKLFKEWIYVLYF